MTSSGRPARAWSGFAPARTWYAAAILLAFAAVFIVARSFHVAAQSARRPATPLQSATRALIEGRYDEVDQLADRLDGRDPNVVALKARAAVARGRYAPAETLLKPVVQRAPTSEAALVLGLLQQMLGRAEATATLQNVAALADTSANAMDLARAARALRALGQFHESNGAYREAAAAAPGDAAINTAWGELFLEKYNRAEATKSFQDVLKSDPQYVP